VGGHIVNILGVNAYHGDVSAALVCDGQLVAAVEEERYRRIKHCAGVPRHAMRACLEMGGLAPADVDVFAVSRDPRAHLWRKAWFLLRHRPRGTVAAHARNLAGVRALPAVLADALGLEHAWVRPRTRFVEHHPAHLASAAFVAPFEEAAVCAIDGFGDFVSTSWGRVAGSRLSVDGHVFFPHSLGMLYLAVTQYLGFPSYGDEFKVMGLAPYGEPRFTREIESLLHLGAGGQFELDLSYFRHASEGVQMTWEDGEPAIGTVFTPKLESLLGPARRRDQPVDARHEALAASLQAVFERAAMHVLRHVQKATGSTKLCLAGGCAMNSVANGKIREETGFRDVFLQPAAGDNGTALGAAFYACHQLRGHRRSFVMEHGYWGPSFDDGPIVAALDAQQAAIAAQACGRRAWTDEAALDDWTASQIADGRVVGWFQGRMEWGARALGNRSIVADPRRADMRDIINTRIKFRERFRPFAPSVLEEALDEYFVGAVPDPFMLQVYPVRPDKRALVPAITHVDGSGRLQTVSPRSNQRYYNLIRAFARVTGVPMLLNTSFNENEPIVLTPDQALDCFLRTSMDVLVIGRHVLERPRVGAEAVGASTARIPDTRPA
jgi:carbamoyltransferase